MPTQLNLGHCLVAAARAWLDHNAIRLSAALSFYATFSLAPMVVLVVAASALLVDPSYSRDEVQRWFGMLIGEDGQRIVTMISQSARSELSGGVLTATVPVVIGATAMFAELQAGLDFIWGVAPSTTIRRMLYQRLVAFVMVLSLSGVLLVSMVTSSLFATAIQGGGVATHVPDPLVTGLSWAMLLLAIASLLTVLYRMLPPASVAWSNALVGGSVTAGLFVVGQVLVSSYLGTSGLSSLYGAAGSLVVVLLWLYYCSMIFFYGAEVTHLLEQRGSTQDE